MCQLLDWQESWMLFGRMKRFGWGELVIWLCQELILEFVFGQCFDEIFFCEIIRMFECWVQMIECGVVEIIDFFFWFCFWD